MTPMLNGFDHVHVYVRDREGAAKWYAQVLGFTPVEKLMVWAVDGGPLTLADFIGLDTCLAIMEVLHDGMGGDSKYRPCPLLRKYVEAGWLGRKSGRGFYTYGGK